MCVNIYIIPTLGIICIMRKITLCEVIIHQCALRFCEFRRIYGEWLKNIIIKWLKSLNLKLTISCIIMLMMSSVMVSSISSMRSSTSVSTTVHPAKATAVCGGVRLAPFADFACFGGDPLPLLVEF